MPPVSKEPATFPVSSQQQQPVRARLQALFSSPPQLPPLDVPLSPTSLSAVTSAPPVITVDPPDLPAVAAPRFLKVRIVSWNMHESLPKVCPWSQYTTKPD